jgi:hypothetical protein
MLLKWNCDRTLPHALSRCLDRLLAKEWKIGKICVTRNVQKIQLKSSKNVSKNSKNIFYFLPIPRIEIDRPLKSFVRHQAMVL